MKVKRKNVRNMTTKNVNKINGHNVKIIEDSSIEDLIKMRKGILKSYSKSLIEYVPLTHSQKLNMIEDMDEISTNRFQEYSNIFEQIKNQIHDINKSIILNSSNNVNENFSSGKKDIKISNCDYIEEKEEENQISPKVTNRKRNKNCKSKFNLNLKRTLNLSSSSSFSSEDNENIKPEISQENIKVSDLHQSPQLKSMYKTRLVNGDYYYSTNTDVYKTTVCTTGENTSMLTLPKVKGKKFNQSDFYYEPKLTEENKDSKTVNVKYCNCLIF